MAVNSPSDSGLFTAIISWATCAKYYLAAAERYELSAIWTGPPCYDHLVPCILSSYAFKRWKEEFLQNFAESRILHGFHLFDNVIFCWCGGKGGGGGGEKVHPLTPPDPIMV